MEELILPIKNQNILTSLELLKQINIFRQQEGNRTELGHNDLLKVIRDEFMEEISLGKISQSTYTNERGREYPMFELTTAQAKQVLVRESKFVRKAVIHYIEQLEEKVKDNNIPKLPTDYLSALKELVKSVEKNIELECKVNRLIHSEKLYTSTEIAKELGFKSAIALNKKLEEKKIQYKVNGTWVLSSQYSECGYTSIKQSEFENGNVIYSRKWTGLGREFILNIFQN